MDDWWGGAGALLVIPVISKSGKFQKLIMLFWLSEGQNIDLRKIKKWGVWFGEKIGQSCLLIKGEALCGSFQLSRFNSLLLS